MPSQAINRITTTQFNGTVISYSGGGSTSSSFNSPVAVQVFEKTRSWVNTPNFWLLRRNGSILPDNSYSLTTWQKSGSLATFSGEYGYPAPGYGPGQRTVVTLYRDWVQRSLTTFSHGVTLTEFDLNSRLVGQARTSSFNLPVTLIEGGRTVQMIGNVASTLAGTIYDLRSGNLAGALSRLGLAPPSSSRRRRYNRDYGLDPSRTAANAWLQYQYGWKPLLNDVKNAAEALAEAVSRNGESMTTSVTASVRKSAQGLAMNQVAEVSPAYTHDVVWKTNLSRRAKWRFRPNSLDLPGLFGLTNPFEVAWEIVPFSFVADWFLPIGDYLKSLDVPLRFQHVGGTKGYRRFDVTECFPKTGEYNIPLTASSGSGVCNYLEISRTPLISAPTPSLSDMRFEPKLGSNRVISAVALLRQQASRLSR